MPKLYEYLGLIVLFYSNEHEPIHVHGKQDERESRADLIIKNGRVTRIVYSSIKGRRPRPTELRHFKKLTRKHANDIVKKWIDYFVLHRQIQAQRISRRIP